MKPTAAARTLDAMITNSLDAAVAAAAAAAPTGAEAVIRVRGLQKRYGDHEAVRGIDLEVRRGEIFAFLGPNGAGKTTTVEILEGFREASGGNIEVLGHDPWKAPGRWRARLGIVLQESGAEPGLTVRECVALYAGYYPAPRNIDETIALVGLAAQSSERAIKLSGGQRRRLDVALALIGDPELIFLDEPTTGFDPSARRAAWEVIDGLRRLGKTIFLTTHYMEEAERLADRIAVIAAGRIVAEGTPQTLGGRQLEASQISFRLPAHVAADDAPVALAERIQTDEDGTLRLPSTAVTADLHELSGWALERGLELDAFEVSRPTLEDVYLQLTREEA